MDVETLGREGDVVRNVVGIIGGEVVQPAAESAKSLGALAQRDGPLIHKLRVQAVHEQSLGTGLDRFRGGAIGKAVLHTKDEPLHPRQDFGEVLAQVEQVVVDIVTESAIIVGDWRIARSFLRLGSRPDYSAARVGIPPDTDIVRVRPEIAGPSVEHFDILVNDLLPVQSIGRHCPKGDFGNDAQCAQRDERGPEELRVLVRRAPLGGTIGKGNAQREDVLRQQTVAKTRTMSSGGDGTGNTLVVDASEVRHGQTKPVQLSTEIVQADARLHGYNALVLVRGQYLVVLVQIDQP